MSSIPLAARAAAWFRIPANFAKKRSASRNPHAPAASSTASLANFPVLILAVNQFSSGRHRVVEMRSIVADVDTVFVFS